MTRYAPGMFCWADLTTNDVEGAITFYTQLFGWTMPERSANEPLGGTIFRKGGLTVCGLVAMDQASVDQGIFPQWRSYIAVENIDELAAKVETLRGKLVSPPYDIPGSGRAAVVRDPSGAEFILWETHGTAGAELVDAPGSWCWNELNSRNVNFAIPFYTGLLGWRAETVKGEHGEEFVQFENNGLPVAGVLGIPATGGGNDAYWEVYFAVEDCDKTAASAEELGGKIDVEPTDVRDQGRFAVLQDPQAGHFAVVQMLDK